MFKYYMDHYTWVKYAERVELCFTDNSELDAESGAFTLDSKDFKYVEAGPFAAPRAQGAKA